MRVEGRQGKSKLARIIVGVAVVGSLTGAASGNEPARVLKDINSTGGEESRSNPSGFTRLNGRLLFAAYESVHGAEPWITDGTEAGTRLVRDLHPGPSSTFESGIGIFHNWQNRAYFSGNDGVSGAELWMTDGTDEGTRLVRDINPGPALSGPQAFAALDSVLLFTAEDGAHGRELWATDGTEAGTHLVRDINPGPASSSPYGFVQFGEALYFFAYDGTPDVRLWRTDGTGAGTYPTAFIESCAWESPVVYRGALWYITWDCSQVLPARLWRSDGTAAGTVPVLNLNVIAAAGVTPAGDTLFFWGQDQSSDVELWATDGTDAGTRRVKDIYAGPSSSAIGPLRVAGSEVFFAAQDADHGPELWKSDGTEAGTILVKDILPGSHNGPPPVILTISGGILLLRAHDGLHGFELWRSDGTEAGTFMVQDLYPGPRSASPSGFVRIGSRVVFSALDATAGNEPWVARTAVLTSQPLLGIEDLAEDLRGLALPDGIEQSLTAKLDAAAAALGRPNGAHDAVSILGAFRNAVAAQTPAMISPEAADDLLEFLAEIVVLLRAGASGISLPDRLRVE
ncbi:MAG TPA: ELWxxDGT repeat protein [Candidatus Polarisedimenticolia bacterium]|nr:ELWxxDGT repeat protein [Candidatus Polarisedimenticolia bacterium]